MTDLYSGIMDGLALARQGADQKRNRLVGGLYSQALTAAPDQRAGLVAQIAQTGGMEAAGNAQAGLGKMDDNAREDLTRTAAQFIAFADQPDQAAAMYPQLAAKAHAIGIPVPPTYDPKMLPAIQKIASLGQHTEQLAPHVIGNTLVDNTGKVLYQGQPQSRMQVVNVPDGQGGSVQMMLDPSTGRFTPPNYGGDQPAPVDPIPGASATPHSLLDPTQDYPQLASAYGATPTSLYRTPEHNAAVGGVPNSQHLRGTAGDFVVPPAQRQQFIADARARGYQPIDEGNHVHLQLPRGAQAAETFGPGQRLGYTPPKQKADANSYRTLSPQEVAQAGLPAGTVAQVDANGKIDVLASTGNKTADSAKADKIAAARADALDSVNQAIDGITSLMHSGGFGNLGTYTGDVLGHIPHTQTRDAQNALETVKNQVLLTTLSKLKALSATGASGFGALSNQEGKILQNSIANLETSQTHDAIVHNLTVIQQTLQRAAGLIGQGGGTAPAQRAAPARSGPRPGDIEDGHRFKGGNPADPNNWEAVR